VIQIGRISKITALDSMWMNLWTTLSFKNRMTRSPGTGSLYYWEENR